MLIREQFRRLNSVSTHENSTFLVIITHGILVVLAGDVPITGAKLKADLPVSILQESPCSCGYYSWILIVWKHIGCLFRIGWESFRRSDYIALLFLNLSHEILIFVLVVVSHKSWHVKMCKSILILLFQLNKSLYAYQPTLLSYPVECFPYGQVPQPLQVSPLFMQLLILGCVRAPWLSPQTSLHCSTILSESPFEIVMRLLFMWLLNLQCKNTLGVFLSCE